MILLSEFSEEMHVVEDGVWKGGARVSSMFKFKNIDEEKLKTA